MNSPLSDSLFLRSSRHGLTLLEVVISAAVLALLMVLLLPVLSQVKERAKQAACLQNIRQFGTGCLALFADGRPLPYWDGQPGPKMGPDSTYPSFPDWLEKGGYFPEDFRLRCPRSTAKDRERQYGMHYGGNSALCIYYNHRPLAIPFPHHRVVLAAEAYSGNFNIPGHLNRTIWANDNGSTKESSEGTAPSWPSPQYHGTRDRRGLHFFFLDGSAALVVPVDNDWSKEPIYGSNNSKGYIYDRDQIRRIKNGTLKP